MKRYNLVDSDSCLIDNVEVIEYKTYTIAPDFLKNGDLDGRKYYKTSEGIEGEFDGERWRSNVKYTGSIKDAKAEIDELISEENELLDSLVK